MNRIMKARYVIGAAVLMSVLLTTNIAQYASANPGGQTNITPNTVSSGNPVDWSFTFVQSVPTVPALHHYDFHSHVIGYRDVAPGQSFSISATDINDCMTKALSSPPSVYVAAAAGNTQGIPAGAQIHFTSSNLTTNFITGKIDNGAPFHLIGSNGVTFEYQFPVGTGPVVQIPPGAGGVTDLLVVWTNSIGGHDDTIGPGTGVLFACSFQDVEQPLVVTEVSGDPDNGDTYDLTHGTFIKTAKLVVGGEVVPLDMTSLFVAGFFTNASWMVPTFGGIAGASLALFKIKKKQS